MTTWYEWKVQCSTDFGWYVVMTKNKTPPTVCPDNSEHMVVPGEEYIISTLSNENPKLEDVNEDGRIKISPGLFPDYMNPYFASQCDNIITGTRGDGTRLVASYADGASTENVLNIQFIDYVQILGGTIRVANANIDDYISLDCYAEATAVTVNVGGTGNCNLYDMGGGANMIVPAAGDGTHDVDLEEPLNANLAGSPGQPTLVTKAVPVPAVEEDGTPIGYYDWDRKTGAITPNPGKGGYYLFNFPFVLSRYINKMAVYSGNEVFKHDTSIFHRGGPVLPQWKCRIYATRASSHAPADPPVIYTFILNIARKYST